MNSRNEKESKPNSLTGVFVTGFFGIVIACVTGVFVLVAALINNGFIAIGPSLQSGRPTVIVVTATLQPKEPPVINQLQATTSGYTPSCNWEKDWQLQTNGSYLWIGSPPGTPGCQNVGQAGEILQRLRNGENLTLIVEVGDGLIGLNICRGNYTATSVIDGQTCVPNNPELWIKVSGTLVVTGSDGFYVGTGK